MLVACRLAGLSALEAYYAGVNRRAQCGRRSADQGIVGQRDRIWAEYGLAAGPHPDWELDPLVPLGIGGAEVVRKISGPSPGDRRGQVERTGQGSPRMEVARSGVLRGARRARGPAPAGGRLGYAYGRFFRAPVNMFPPAAGAMTP